MNQQLLRCYAAPTLRRLLSSSCALAYSLICYLTCSLLLTSAGHAQTAPHAIVAVDAIALAQHVEVRITLDTAVDSIPRHFSTTHPARIVLDLAPTTNATGTGHAAFDFDAAADQHILESYAIIHAAQRTRIVLRLTQTAAYTVSKAAQAIIIRIDQPPASTPLLPSKNNDKLSLNFQNVDVRALLQIFADFAGINIVASDSVNGAVSVRLKEVPWQQALHIILQARKLEMRQHGDVLWIAPRVELLASEKIELEQRAQIAALEPLHTEVFQLNYQNAETVRKLFGVRQGPEADAHPHLLSRRGSTLVDPRTNQLFVTDTQNVLDKVRRLLAKIDLASRQVLIAARIVEADHAFSRHLGVRLGFSASAKQLVTNSGSNPEHTGNVAVNLPASPLSAFQPANFAISLFNASAGRFLNLELSALEADGKGQIISSPSVVTTNKQAALIEQGEEIPYQQSAGNGATSTAFKKANLKLEVTPQITPDGNIILDVDINKDSRGIATPGGLAINTKHIRTQVQVEDGGTVVIGGIYTQIASSTVAQVPLLGKLPLLGYLFKNTADIANKTELLIFLTPKIVATPHFPREAGTKAQPN